MIDSKYERDMPGEKVWIQEQSVVWRYCVYFYTVYSVVDQVG